jgi:3-hydroxyacyl-CoA dehydrogenase/enoyl-CoA hydratase/3-hydroxybutyryl-CoA epimerase
VDKMPLVELIVGEKTSDAALARAYDVVRQIGKTPIVVQDSRGFFTSRVFGTLVLEGAALLAEGVAPMTIERAALQAGFPAGPLTLLDEVTLTLPLKISDEAKKAGSAEDHPGLAVVRALVEQGRTGKTAGKGFFDWAPEKRVWPGLAELYPSTDAVAFRDVQERLLFAMAVETARCVEERMLNSVEDANIGSIMGIGFPPLYGGVLQYVDQYAGGVAAFVARADELADAYGERFRPPALLLERAVPAGSLRAAVGA